ncbi:MAG: S24 family peptidase [Deinococcales bacterium]
MEKASNMQQKIYDRLRKVVLSTGELPNLSDFAREVGITYMTLQQHLKALDRKGYLSFHSRGRGQAPILKLFRLGIPLMGQVTAGKTETREQEIQGYLSLYGSNDENTFALRVDGNSMADLIQDKDVVILQKEIPSRSGLICAVTTNGETTLKYVDWEGAKIGETVILRPHNTVDFKPFEVKSREVEINGVYKSLLRGDLIHHFLSEA